MLRNLYNSIFRMTPAHIILEVYGRYLGKYEVPIKYENKIRFFSEFYPRFNLAVLKLDGTWKLDGGRKLNGYDSNETLDFYPVAMSVSVPVAVPVQTELSCRYQMTAMENVKAEAALNICTEAAENVRMEQRLACQSGAEVSVLQAEAFMYKKNMLNGSWKLNGSRKLDGGRYNL